MQSQVLPTCLVLVLTATGVARGQCWSEQAKVTAADGTAGDRFGVSVDVAGDTGLVGAMWDEPNGVRSGSAYVFGRRANLSNALEFTVEAALLQ